MLRLADDRQALLDGGQIQKLLQRVGHAIEPGLADFTVALAAPVHSCPRRATLAEEGGAEAVRLEQAVQLGAEHPAVGAWHPSHPGGPSSRFGPGPAVVDLVARRRRGPAPCPASTGSSSRPRTRCRSAGGPGRRRRPGAAGLDLVLDLPAEHLVAAADAEDGGRRPGGSAMAVSTTRPVRSHSRSATVALVPGRTTRSGPAEGGGRLDQPEGTPVSTARASRSVKLEMRGRRTTATSTTWAWVADRAVASCQPRGQAERSPRRRGPGRPARAARRGSARRCGARVPAGRRPSRAGSPRNLLMTKPPTVARRSSGSRATVPYRAANTPPRSMSPTMIAGRPAAAARRRLTMSRVEQVDLRRAARPLADHHVEAAAAGRRALEHEAEQRRLGVAGRRRRRGCAQGRPMTITWLVRSDCRLEQDGVHGHLGRDTGGLGLGRLGPPDLVPGGGHGRVERHVLGLERRHPDAAPGQQPAQPGHHRRLAGVAGGAADHQPAPQHRRSQGRLQAGQAGLRPGTAMRTVPGSPKLAQSRTEMARAARRSRRSGASTSTQLASDGPGW